MAVFTASLAGTAISFITFAIAVFATWIRITFSFFTLFAFATAFTAFASILITTVVGIILSLYAANGQDLGRMLSVRFLEMVVVSKFGVLLELDSIDIFAMCIHDVNKLVV